jgi:Zn-dependent protease
MTPLLQNLADILMQIGVLLFSVILHEVAHGAAAARCGDGTAREAGRLTFNPIPHIDPMGTVILPTLLAVTHSPILFGWAKPVPINPWRFRRPKRDLAIVGAAGPLSNLAAAGLSAALFRLLLPWAGLDHPLTRFLLAAAVVNTVLALFNLIPIPPLDGSRLLVGLLPARLAAAYLRLERFGLALIIILMFFGLNERLLRPAVRIVLGWLLG